MRLLNLIFFLAFSLAARQGFAQSDSTASKKYPQHVYTANDTLYLAKLNSSGNLMIAGGVGLCGAGTFLIYQGNKTYSSTNAAITAEDIQRNHRQGTIYYAAGGIAIAGGIVLTAFGARNKVDFKLRKKMMELKAGMLDNGNLGATLNF